MRKLFLLILIFISSYSFAQDSVIVSGKEPSSAHWGYVYHLYPTLLTHPFYFINANTIGFDSARYYLSSFTKNGTGDSTIITFADGTRFAALGGNTNGSGTSGYLTQWSGTHSQISSGIYFNGTNYGIGTTTPSYNFEIRANGSANNSPSIITNYNNRTVGTAANGSGIAFNYLSQSTVAYDSYMAQAWITWVDATGATRRAQWVDYMMNNGTATKTAISRVLQSDQTNVWVGINTATPIAPLTVNGIAKYLTKQTFTDSTGADSNTVITATGVQRMSFGRADTIPLSNLAADTTALCPGLASIKISSTKDSTILKQRIFQIASATTPTPNMDTTSMYIITAQSVNPTIANPTGATPNEGREYHIRMIDNGTAQGPIFWGTIWRGSNVMPLPTYTIPGQNMNLDFRYNAVDNKWDLISPTNTVLSGSYSATGTATTAFTVTFGGTEPNTTYVVNVTPTNALSAAVLYVVTKTTTTFTVTYLTGLTGGVSFDWALFTKP